MKLTQKQHAAAVEYLKTKARSLEAALYDVEFDNASTEPAVHALAAFQNNDGGFGNGLECDMRLRDSSVVATTIAFQHFRTLGLLHDHPMVQRACQYLNTQYIPSEKRWCIMPANIDDAPHAPWWQPGGDLWNSRVNPTAEILGYMYEYPEHFDAAQRDDLTRDLADYLNAHDNQPMEMHDLLCYIALVENPGVPDAVKMQFLPTLKRIVDKTVERSPAKWPEYTIPPLAVINTPSSPFISLFENELPENWKFLFTWLGDDGAWHPNWQWGEPDEWQPVEREWSGVLTLNNLKKLRAFGLIAGVKDD